MISVTLAHNTGGIVTNATQLHRGVHRTASMAQSRGTGVADWQSDEQQVQNVQRVPKQRRCQ